ncbi:MAG: (2Fe-2S)-binding protein, partial [Desulfobacterales bacterium]
MTPVFIFSDDIRNALADGKSEIEIPEGARISAAAYDIIRDNQIRLIYVKAAQTASEPQEPEEHKGSPEAKKRRDLVERTAPDSKPEAGGEITDAVLEDIVDRVIARFKELKGLKPETADATDSPGIESDADADQDDDLVICRCEEITRGEIKDAIKNGMRTLNGIKRITRAGMGLCQGQTCQRLVAQILTEELGFSAAEIDPTTARGPVRPLRLEVFA